MCDEGEAMATRNQIASLLDHMADQIFVAADPYEQDAEFRWFCEQSGQATWPRQAHSPDVSFGLGLCQEPSGAMSASACFGPQLWRL